MLVRNLVLKTAALGPVTAVLHMGAISATTETDGDLVAATNLTLPLWLWSACAERRVPFIYASSAATYGDGHAGFEDDASPEALAKAGGKWRPFRTVASWYLWQTLSK